MRSALFLVSRLSGPLPCGVDGTLRTSPGEVDRRVVRAELEREDMVVFDAFGAFQKTASLGKIECEHIEPTHKHGQLSLVLFDFR